jgi:ubiquinone/menaquinone biosynthesis C-methylase UbiE
MNQVDGNRYNKIIELKGALQEINKLSNSYWIDSLELRKQLEIDFHDRYRDRELAIDLDKNTFEQIHGSQRYKSIMTDTDNYMYNWVEREANNRVFLDYCCGDGGTAIHAAMSGSILSIGIDLSLVSINNAWKSVEKIGLENVYFVQADAEHTKLPDNSIDRIICCGVLHHLDIANAFPELHRILVDGGKVLVIEALNYNPAFKLYRYLTPYMRTEWEKAHILSLKDVNYAKNFFEIRDIRYWHILRLLGPHFSKLDNLFRSLDQILTKIPLVQLMSWVFSFEMIKRSQ